MFTTGVTAMCTAVTSFLTENKTDPSKNLPFIRTIKEIEGIANKISSSLKGMKEGDAAKIINDLPETLHHANDALKSATTLTKTLTHVSTIGFGGGIGGIIGWTMSAMTGMAALTPLGALIGVAINDFNKFCKGELPDQNKKEPANQQILNLAAQYIQFRLCGKGREKSAASITPSTAPAPTSDNDIFYDALENEPTKEEEVQALLKEKGIENGIDRLSDIAKSISSSNNTITEDTIEDILNNNNSWKALTQKRSWFGFVHTPIFTADEEKSLKEYLQAEILNLNKKKNTDTD